ncbi:odorant receptor 131-2-like [Osmerus eperlanus]|uniref:odorant receptor 131-2-like n=1 Tax=Osmerus eperlanus TaxID=29151 RepID=UPI002E1505D3
MNSTTRLDDFNNAFIKNFISCFLGVLINTINGFFVYIFFRNATFQRDPRYILYVHLVLNDILMLTIAVFLQILSYLVPFINLSFCCFLVLLAVTTDRNSPFNLAGMAVERYIAVCRPLHHAQICTVRRTYVLIGLIWCVSLVPSLSDIVLLLVTQPLAIFSSRVRCHVAAVNYTPYHQGQSVAVQVINLSFVFLTLIVTYLKVMFAARRATTDQASAMKARNTILLHALQLLICMLAYFTPLTNMVLLYAFPQQRTTILFTNFLFTSILPRLLSPLIYGVRDQKMLNCIKVSLSCRQTTARSESVFNLFSFSLQRLLDHYINFEA